MSRFPAPIDATASELLDDITGPPAVIDVTPESIDGADRRPIPGANSQRMSFEKATNQIIRQGDGLGSERIPLGKMRMEGGRIIARDREFSVDALGFRRLCNRFRAPSDYLEKLPADTRDGLLTHHLRSQGQAHRGLVDSTSRLIHRGGAFVDFGRADLHTIGSGEVLNAVRDGFGSDAATFEVQNLEIHDEAFCLDLVSPSVAMEVRRGDLIEAGVRVEHSYTGDRATTVMAFAVRLTCTNGMVHRECVGSRRTARTRRLNADREDAGSLQFEQIRRMTEEVRKGLEPKLAAIRKLADERAELGEINKFLGQARMRSASIERQVRHAWEVEGSEGNAFGLFNALTRLATHGTDAVYRQSHPREAILSSRQRAALSRLAGIYANRSNHSICPHCFSVINSPTTN